MEYFIIILESSHINYIQYHYIQYMKNISEKIYRKTVQVEEEGGIHAGMLFS